MRALILEDNRDRRVAMIGRLAERFPFLRVDFFDTSAKMIDFMESDSLQDVAMISLDHDLELIPGLQGDWIDPGTGLDVARWLADRSKPLCPVVVHTTNSRAGTKMMRLLEKSHWISHRVIPHDDLDWIETDWFRVVRNGIVDFAPQRRETRALPVESKVGLGETPAAILQEVANLKFPPETEARMTSLMDRNSDGSLTPTERDELAAMVNWGHRISLLRARAMLILGHKP
jgi:hypothetical protein